ncbi:MAG: metallophosphoesterase [Aerococcaceae bacterium]|nr:metallophosphoesterase [Aerococcaceae bacterium]
MKFLVLSDNHGLWNVVHNLLQHFGPQVDYVFHCGDSEFTSDDPIWEQVSCVVAGNMDFDPQYVPQQIVETPVGKVFVAHGHRHQINQSNDTLYQVAKDSDCRFVFHGHTHVLYAEYREGILLMNPGSINHSRGNHHGTTFAIVTVDDAQINVEYYDSLTYECLPELSRSFSR